MFVLTGGPIYQVPGAEGQVPALSLCSRSRSIIPTWMGQLNLKCEQTCP